MYRICARNVPSINVRKLSSCMEHCCYTEVVMTVYWPECCRKEFASETVYSPNYTKVLSFAVTCDYTLTEGSGKDNSINYRNRTTAGRFHAFYQRQTKIEESSLGPLCDRRDENQSSFSFSFLPPTRTVTGSYTEGAPYTTVVDKLFNLIGDQ